jgi:hypothetical protein
MVVPMADKDFLKLVNRVQYLVNHAHKFQETGYRLVLHLSDCAPIVSQVTECLFDAPRGVTGAVSLDMQRALEDEFRRGV